MTRSTARWTTALAAAALLAIPAGGAAQTGTAATTSAQQQPPASTEPSAQDTNAAQEHLRKAKAALDEIDATAVTGRAKTRLTELKRHVAALERAPGSGSSASATGAARRTMPATPSRGATWGAQVTQISKILNELIGPEGGATPTTGDPTAATGATGTTGTAGSAAPPRPGTSAAMTIDAATRAKLEEVRSHITAYAAAMSGAQMDQNAQSAAPSATGTMGTTGTSGAASATAGTTSGTTTSTPPTTGTAGTQTSAAQTTTATQTTGTEPQPAAQADAEAARRHLTDARNTLSELTQLPAAAQLTGDARTQISQLITNFNTLITSQSNWRESFDKVEANLNALIGPETTDEPLRTAATTGTATGTAGAVGTSGTTAAVNLDATIRAKLVDLRQKLNAFEQAAGGGAAGQTSGTTATGTTTGAAGTTAGTTATSSTAGTTGTATGTATAATDPQTAQKSEAMGHSEAMRLIEAIEAILNRASGGGTSATAGTATGTSGTATTANVMLTPEQLEQLRTHLAALRKLMGEADRK